MVIRSIKNNVKKKFKIDKNQNNKKNIILMKNNYIKLIKYL